VLLDITNSNFSTYAQSNGNDFFFTDISQTKLNHEIESYNSSSGHLIAWLNVPSLSSSQNTVLYLYYGNPSATNQQNPSAVWDQNYMMVQHLKETTGQVNDSTANANSGSPHGGVTQGITGKIDGADGFDGSTGYVEVPASNSLAGYTQGFTISLWVNFNNVSSRQTILNKFNTPSQESWFLEYSPTNGLGFFASQNGASYSEWHATSFKPTAGTWYYVTVVWTSNSVPKFFVNGLQLSTVGNAVIAQLYNNAATSLLIGKSAYATGRGFNGIIDEITLSNIGRSLGWIQTNYNLESNPSATYTIANTETN
jgi:MSHA biogenesis protein MshQ